MSAATVERERATYALRLGDDALVLSHRLSQWITLAPELEEDMALANISLDLLGQARVLLAHGGELEGEARDEDDLAFLRSEREFLNVQLVEQENGDFAQTIARQLLFSTYQLALYERLLRSSDETLAGVAGKAVKEVAYHVDHAVQWTLRLGDGTDESHRRMQAGLDRMWPFVDELFELDPLAERLVADGVAVDPTELRPGWDRDIDGVLARGDAQPSRGPGPAHRRAQRPAHRGLRPHARRDAAPAPLPPRSDLVSAAGKIRAAVGAVPDPEIPVLTVDDLGIVRDVQVDGDRVLVEITPTYSGCPAIDPIRREVERAVRAQGYRGRGGSDGAGAGLEHRLDQRGGPAQAPGLRHRSTRAAPRCRVPARGPGSPLPSLRLDRDAPGQPLRRHSLSGAFRLPCLRGALRPLQDVA